MGDSPSDGGFLFRAALDTWMVETGDRGDILEQPEMVEPFEKEMDRWFGTPDWFRRM